MKSRSDVVKESYNFNCGLIPTKLGNGIGTTGSWFNTNSSTVILETVKPCEPPIGAEKHDIRKTLIRLFESCGERTAARFVSSFFLN